MLDLSQRNYNAYVDVQAQIGLQSDYPETNIFTRGCFSEDFFEVRVLEVIKTK